MTTTSRIRKIAVILGIAGTCLLQVAPVFAQAQPPAGGANSFQGALEPGLKQAAPPELQGNTDPAVIVARIIGVALGLLGVLLFVYFLYAGFLWMTAGGESKKVDLATAHIKNSVIGLIIIILAYSATSFVISRLSNVLSATPIGS